MKTNMLSSLVIVLMIVIVSTGCESFTSKNLKSTKENTEEPNVNLNKVIKESQEEIKATAKVDWEKFNKDSQIAIKERQIQIEELRGEISEISNKEQQKLTSILDSLDHKNKNLKERLAQINKKLKTNMEHLNESDEVLKIAFESTFVHEMNELIAGIRDFWKNKQ
ncbi:hypothetical protein [Bizionia myxarmorum]|uniref:Uncharacterized protein n=1 Tax=Bizionia myxarmorum TaxID=291186 RepID=A0A5D0RFE4_9FLAO|nr:hypothetical protein [Bizionia myxarmorum]TYB79505.1 hypothetical protein ES674_07015 [Bizionia myxarmorum]